jgi:hypothetical protein
MRKYPTMTFIMFCKMRIQPFSAEIGRKIQRIEGITTDYLEERDSTGTTRWGIFV